MENVACAREAEHVASLRLWGSMTSRGVCGYRATVEKTVPGINRWF